MGGDRRTDEDDRVRVTRHPRGRPPTVAWLVLALAVLAVGALGWRAAERRAAFARARDAGPATTAPDAAATAAAGGATAAGRARVVRASARGATTPDNGEDPTPDLSDYVLPSEAPSMAQVIETLHSRGIRTGLGAFPPPGTSPPLRGLAVPEDFPLPPGYVRHHQATDDGQTIPAILMFAPDVEWVTVRGVRVRVPTNHVVPPELAPPGLPLHWVDIPPPVDSGSRP